MSEQMNKMTFEEALDMTVTGCNRYVWLLFLLISGIIISTTFEIFSMSYLVSASACELDISSDVQGLLLYVPLIGAIGTSYLWGYLADTRGRRKILIISLAITYIAATAAAFSPHWIVFSLLKFVSSASASGSFALSITLLGECTPKLQRNCMVLLTTSAYMLGVGLLAVLTIPILPMTFSYYWSFPGIYFNSWRLLDLLVAVPCALSAIGCYYVHESPKYLVNADREKEGLEVLKAIFIRNTGKSADEFQVCSLDLDEEQSPSVRTRFWDSIVTQTMPIVKPPLLKQTLLLALLYVISFNTMNAFIVSMPFVANAFVVSVRNGQDEITACEMIRYTANIPATKEIKECSSYSSDLTLVGVFTITMVIAFRNLISGKMINVIRRKRLFILVQVEAGIAGLVLNFNSARVLVAVMFMIAMSGIFNFGTLTSYIIDTYPTSVRAMAVSTIPMIGLGTGVIGIHFFKVLLDTNCEVAFYVYGSLAICGCFVGLLLPKDEIKQEEEAAEDDMSEY